VARWENELDHEALERALGSRSRALAAPPDPAAGPGDPEILTAD
jgi:aerobic C4-dicarboxylate transport protein